MLNIRICLNEKCCAGYFQESMILHRICMSMYIYIFLNVTKKITNNRSYCRSTFNLILSSNNFNYKMSDNKQYSNRCYSESIKNWGTCFYSIFCFEYFIIE